ncbi:hypothetical protein HMPREF1604_03115 [Escherichia coli 908519]|nr:hypothetical protein HMPREF1604_03115 [Escherichia coli 908519]
MPSVAVLVYSMKSSQWRPAVKRARAVIVLQGKPSPPSTWNFWHHGP